MGLVVRSPFRAKHHVVVQYGKVDEMSHAPLPLPLPLPDPPPPARPHTHTHTHTRGRQGGQGRIDDITGKGLRTAVALSTACCFQFMAAVASHTGGVVCRELRVRGCSVVVHKWKSAFSSFRCA